MSWKLYYANPDGSNEQNVKLESLGALEGGQVTGDGIRFQFCSHRASTMTISIPNFDPALALPVIVFSGRVRLVDQNGVQQFVGRRVDWNGTASASNKGFKYVFQDAWWDLSKTTFKQAWWSGSYLPVVVAGGTGTLTSVYFTWITPRLGVQCNFYNNAKAQIGAGWSCTQVPGSQTQFTISGGVGTSTGAKFVSFYYSFTDVVLFQYIPNDPYLTVASVFQYYITTGQQIVAALNFAIANGVFLQVGEIDPTLYVAWYPVRAQRVDEVLKICLRSHPDMFTEIDYTTTPPTFHVRARGSLTSKLLPYNYTTARGVQAISTDVKPRPELIPNRIGIFYRYVVDGKTIAWPTDIYPPDAPDGLLAEDYSLDLQGPRIGVSTGEVVSSLLPAPLVTFDPSNPDDFWIRKFPRFQNNTAFNPTTGEIDGNFATHIALCDASGNTTSPAVNVVDQTGAAVDTTVYQWELIGGGQALWMSGVQVVAATIQTWFNYKKRHINTDGTVGGTTPDSVVSAESVSVNVNLVNVPSLTQAFAQYLSTGEAIPPNLAQSIYQSLQTLQYNLRQTQREEPFTSFIKPGKHCVNLDGGNAEWTIMNATVQDTTYTLKQRPDGVVWAISDVSCGPVEHLEAGDLVQLFNIFANRDLNKIDPWERITGQTAGGAGSQPVQNTAKENSMALPPAQSATGVVGVDAANTSGTVRQNVTVDGTTGQTKVQQVDSTNTSIPNTTGLVVVELNNSGPPGPSTLG